MEDEKHRKFWETRAEEILEETLNEYFTLYPNHKLPVQPRLKEKYLNMTVRRWDLKISMIIVNIGVT